VIFGSKYQCAHTHLYVCYFLLNIKHGASQLTVVFGGLQLSGVGTAMSHIVESCWLTKLDGGLMRLNEADDVTVDWLKDTAASALAK